MVSQIISEAGCTKQIVEVSSDTNIFRGYDSRECTGNQIERRSER